jgi:NADH-quinone oxidoreductase subunit A
VLSEYVPLLIFAAIIVGLVIVLVLLGFVAGPYRPSRHKYDPYESGIIPTSSARRRVSVRFYLTAMLFIVFDVETVFFYPWAVILKQLRWFGVIEMFIFMLILVVALAHIWRKGGLEWE